MRLVLAAAALSLAGGLPALAQERLHVGATVQGELATGDDQLQSGEFSDVYEIAGRAGQSLLVTLRSGDFDAYLMVDGPGGFDEQNDDDGDGGTNAALNLRLPADGTYNVIATSFEPGQSGRYSLSVLGLGDGGNDTTTTPTGPADPPPPVLPPPGARPTQESLRLLEAHNVERRRLGVPELIWSDSLADDARVWARNLSVSDTLEHDPHADGQGENLWAGWGRSYEPEEMVDGWISERVDYQPGVFPDVSRTGDWRAVGHYTQLIWRGTTHLGCAIESGRDKSILVCRYSPPGNVMGSRP